VFAFVNLIVYKSLLNNQTDIEAGNRAEVGHYHMTLFNSFIGTQNQIPWLEVLDINGKLQMYEIYSCKTEVGEVYHFVDLIQSNLNKGY
jgi:hypothetical protein